MKITSYERTCRHMLAACFILVCTGAAQAQTAPSSSPASPVSPTANVVTNVVRQASPLVQIGIQPGSIHKIGVGLGVAKFRTIQIGLNGWISVECLEDNKAGWLPGEKYWVNTGSVVFISAPFVSSSNPPLEPAVKTPVKTPEKAPVKTKTR
jgi:hypothetical protein